MLLLRSPKPVTSLLIPPTEPTVLRAFWPADECYAFAEAILGGPAGAPTRKALQVGGPTLRDMIYWTRTDHTALWDACAARLPAGPSHGGHVVIRYRTGVELKEHRDDGAMRLVLLARAAERGGDLLYEAAHIPLLVGDAIVFDDSKLHEVTRIEEGERWTITMGTWWRK